MIEVEKKARFAESDKAHIIQTILAQPGVQDLGDNDTDSVFYLTDREQIKVQKQISKGRAKIAWKSGGNGGQSARREIEVPIAPADTEAAEALVEAMLPHATRFNASQQKRHDYRIDGIEIAVKWSVNWQDHIELELLVDDAAVIPNALAKLDALADTLGVQLMTEAEEKAFVAQILAGHMSQRGKLVRDKIPEIIRQQGREPKVRTLAAGEYRTELVKKLHEEVAEFTEDNNAEELADILEVVHALAQDIGLSLAELETVRANKVQERGDFSERTYINLIN